MLAVTRKYVIYCILYFKALTIFTSSNALRHSILVKSYVDACLSVCMSVCHICIEPTEARRALQLWSLSYRWLCAAVWALGTKGCVCVCSCRMHVTVWLHMPVHTHVEAKARSRCSRPAHPETQPLGLELVLLARLAVSCSLPV